MVGGERLPFLLAITKKRPLGRFLVWLVFWVLIKGVARSNSEYKSIDYD